MKHIFLLLAVVFLALSCKKEDVTANSEIPDWLQDKIEQDEKTIQANPKLMSGFGAWIKYEYQGKTYFEYDNPISSMKGFPYTWDGSSINTTLPPFTDYNSKKCCKEIVWKAPHYLEL